MSKYRSVGKPARLAGPGRKLIRAFADTTQLEDNEFMKASKEICYGLAVFHAMFGSECNAQESSFHGFSPHEIRLATDKSEIRTNQVEKEHRARGVLFKPYTLGRNQLIPVSSLITASKKGGQTKKKTPCDEKKSSHLTKSTANESVIFKKNKSEFIHRTKKSTEKVVGTTNVEVNSRSIPRRFVLPVRSAHSSRVIKPNKRFRDIDVDAANCDGSDGKIAKKIKLAAETCSDDSSSSWIEKRTEKSSQVNSDEERNSMSGYWSSSISTASSSLKDEQVFSKSQGKVILRKAKLKVDPDPPPVVGPFSKGCANSVRQKVVCGVCGAVRYYKYLKQSRKFGIYSCESCRKFISRTIAQSSTEIINCKVGDGKCVIPQYQIDPVTGLRTNQRCKACWLKMCLRSYCMPDDHEWLTARLPLSLRNNVAYSPTTKLIPKKQADSNQLMNKSNRHNLNSSMISSGVSDKVVKKQIILAKSIRRKAEAIARKGAKKNQGIPSSSDSKKNVLNIKSKPRTVSSKIATNCKLNASKVSIKRKEGNRVCKNSVELNVKRKKNKIEKNKREEKVILQKLSLKGPRVKHVCRSASLVLGQPVATFTDASPSKLKDYPKGNLCDDEGTVITMQLSGSDRQPDETIGSSCLKSTEQGSKIRQACDDSNMQPSGKKQSTISKTLVPAESTEAGLLDGKARTLQDLTRQHYELINGATMGDDITLISIDFWESYDPEEVFKTGFALIGIGDSFDTRAICFICGSAGLDKVIHCACCCEPYHHYCVEGSEAEDWWRVNWVCARCTLCHTCGKGGSVQVACQRCRKSYHTDCLAADRLASRLHSADRPWVCLSCLCCKSCNQSEVYKFVGNLPLCRVCFKLRQKGNFCPLCQRCYDENDFDTKMMECERCKCWVHARCEGLSNEKYQILSILPDSVEFVCRLCCKIHPAPWRLAVETEMKAGFIAVLKSLGKNRKACDLLKWSPTKRSSMCVCSTGLRQGTLRFPDLSEQSDAESLDMRIQNECHRDETMIVEEECLKNLPSFSTESEENIVCDPKSETSEKSTSLCDLRTKYNVRECSVLVKNEDLQLKLDSDVISYQNTDEKPSQFSPHATSQSDSGIGSTDDELKSTNDQCFCLGLEVWNKTPQTLLTIKKKVNSNEYSSLDGFNKEMEEIINCVQGTELLKLYHQALEDTFPWFDPKSSEVLDSSTRINHNMDSNIEVKAVSEEKHEDVEVGESGGEVLKEKLNRSCDYYYNIKKPVDNRTCILCKFVGEGKTTEEGRLLYCGQNEWVHTNCALWSNEVYEEIDGSLQNVQSAISRSRHIRCSKCSKKGASVGCCNRSCPEAYHFNCALNSDCTFFEDKSLFCVNHTNDAKHSRPLVPGPDFLVSRPVYVELERKKKKYIAKHDVHIMIGSLTINSLGEFVPDLSDQESSIVPCNYHCTRMFWSSLEPWRLVQYTIKTKIIYTITDESIENDKNFTIDHSLDTYKAHHEKKSLKKCSPVSGSQVKEVIEYMLDVVCSKDEEDTQAAADLLSPELEEAIFEDLPNDLLDGISMQDIFHKLMNFEASTTEVKSDKECKNVSSTNSNNRSKDKKKSSPGVVSSFSHGKLPITNSEFAIKGDSQCNISCKRKSKFHNKTFNLHKQDEKENSDKWSSTKIIQIDGTGDCSSESSDFGSPVKDKLCLTVLCAGVQKKAERWLFQAKTSRKSRILQVDGVVDSFTSSCSSSECGSPERDNQSFWKLGQVDGAMDFCTNKDSELLEESPVKCTRCHRTYRTAQSFERHLQTCSVDYILSCSESDSSEEDKVSSSEVKLTDVEDVISNPLCIDHSQAMGSESVENNAGNGLSDNLNHQPSNVCLSQQNHLNNSLVQPKQVYLYNNNGLEASILPQNSVHNQVLIDQSSNICGHPIDLPTETYANSSILTSEVQQPYPSKPKTIRAMFECGDSQLPHISTSFGRTSPVRIRPVKTYTRRKKVTTCTTATLEAVKSSQLEPMLDYQTSTSPALIIQQVPSHAVMPSFIESMPHQATSNNIQYQYIATLDMQEKPQLPLTIQLQPPISIQPVMPTVLGTLIQPNGIEQLVVNTPTQTMEMLNQQPTNVYITNMNQPMYVGMETVVSNTVMSSSQFVSGMLTGSSYSATTTQVFQTAKPVMDLPQSYVVVNTHTNPLSDNVPQTVYSPHSSQPWTYNYQETYKVKERTTYQQVTRQIIQEEKKADHIKMMNSAQRARYLEKPIVQEVTVEKTHSFHKTGPVPGLPNVASRMNPLATNGRVDCDQYSHNKLLFGNNITENELSGENCTRKDITERKTHIPPNKPSSCSEENTIQENCKQLALKNGIENNSKDNLEITQYNDKHVLNNCQLSLMEKLVKPVITKVKSNPNVKNCNFSVNLVKVKTNGFNDNKPVSPEKINAQSPVKPVELPLKVIDFPSDYCTSKSGSDAKVENLKSVPTKRMPFNENKVVMNKAKFNRNSLKKNGASHHLSNPKLVYEISSQDGISICSQDLAEAWQKIVEAVQSARAAKRLPPLPQNPLVSHLRMLGLDNNSVKYLIEQLPGVGNCTKYKPTYHKSKLFGHSEQLRENPTGCARSEVYSNTRRKYDMFSWLASRHRRPPKLIINSDTEIVNGISRRATSLNLPMAMRFRHLKETSKEAVGVFRSDIHGRGLFCLRDIDSGEMVIEYAGEVIRAGLTDQREHYYTSKGIGCYMFRIDDHFVVDATMHGNAARFINHSCEPNCYSRVVDILGKKHILIFALRKIPQGEELTYDYKFPLEDDKITCHCLSRKCRKYLN